MNKSYIIKQIEEELQGVVETPHLDALFFVEYYERQNKEITKELISDFLLRRKNAEPVSKIVGERGFWTLDFKVSKDVLDPRADTETLIDAVLKHIPQKDEPLSILDVGTGSGCLIVTLLSEYKNATGIAVDVSQKALEIAKENAKGYPVIFYQKDFYQSDFGLNFPKFDVIVSNPPYIPSNDVLALEKNVRLYDPLLALDGGEDGLNAYRALAKNLKNLLKKDGLIFFEIGQNQEEDVKRIMLDEGYAFLNQYKDLGGIIRVLVFSSSKV